VINPEMVEHRLLTPAELAVMVIHLRAEKGWTQETVAELARVSVRTVQRLEEGLPCSLDTRRALAAVFAFEDVDTFSKPWALPNIEKLKEEAVRIEKETVAVLVEHVTKGKQLRELAERVNSYLLTSTEEADEESEAQLAELRELFSGYGDVHELYTPKQKLGMNGHFQEHIDALAARKIGLVAGARPVLFHFANARRDDGIPFEVGYAVAGPAEALPDIIRVPRKGNFRF
jgi:transcriptional regulator with XRE-family HTH domain